MKRQSPPTRSPPGAASPLASWPRLSGGLASYLWPSNGTGGPVGPQGHLDIVSAPLPISCRPGKSASTPQPTEAVWMCAWAGGRARARSSSCRRTGTTRSRRTATPSSSAARRAKGTCAARASPFLPPTLSNFLSNSLHFALCSIFLPAIALIFQTLSPHYICACSPQLIKHNCPIYLSLSLPPYPSLPFSY